MNSWVNKATYPRNFTRVRRHYPSSSRQKNQHMVVSWKSNGRVSKVPYPYTTTASCRGMRHGPRMTQPLTTDFCWTSRPVVAHAGSRSLLMEYSKRPAKPAEGDENDCDAGRCFFPTLQRAVRIRRDEMLLLVWRWRNQRIQANE